MINFGPTRPVNTPSSRSMRRAYRTAVRRLEKLCVQCGDKILFSESDYCLKCQAKRQMSDQKYQKAKIKSGGGLWIARDRKNNPEKYAQKQREEYQRRKDEGLCVSCVYATAEGSIFCEKHRAEDRERCRKRAEERRISQQLKTLYHWSRGVKRLKLFNIRPVVKRRLTA